MDQLTYVGEGWSHFPRNLGWIIFQAIVLTLLTSGFSRDSSPHSFLSSGDKPFKPCVSTPQPHTYARARMCAHTHTVTHIQSKPNMEDFLQLSVPSGFVCLPSLFSHSLFLWRNGGSCSVLCHTGKAVFICAGKRTGCILSARANQQELKLNQTINPKLKSTEMYLLKLQSAPNVYFVINVKYNKTIFKLLKHII